MNFVSSLFLGSVGQYNFFGQSVSFTDQFQNSTPSHILQENCIISTLIIPLRNRYISCLSGGYAHVFVHEMGHALAYKLLTGNHSPVFIYQNPCSGGTDYPTITITTGWKSTVINLAGPMMGIAFEIGKLVAAAALFNICWPASLLLASGAVIWITGELVYAITSSFGATGDFSIIRRNGGILHLVLSLILLIAACVFGVLAAATLL